MSFQNTHYIVIATGTSGDVYPFIGLAKLFQSRGRKVTLIGSAFHSNLFRKSGLPFVSFGTREEYCQRYDNPNIWNPQKGFAALFTGFSLPWRQIADALQALQTQERCVVIAHQIALPAAELVRESGADIKIVGVCLAPSNLRTCYDPLNIGPMPVPKWLPMSWRRLLWRVIEARLIDPIAVAEVNVLRAKAPGLIPIKSYLAHTAGVADLTVMLVPKWFAGPHPDWPRPLHMATFPLYEPSPDAALPADLMDFLSSGDRPIVFTPGTGHAHADAFFRAAIATCARLKRRAIFLTPLRTQIQAALPDAVHWQPYI
jgi:rhamnosyltransferase subunit B